MRILCTKIRACGSRTKDSEMVLYKYHIGECCLETSPLKNSKYLHLNVKETYLPIVALEWPVVVDFVIIGCGVVGCVAVKEKTWKILEYLSVVETKQHLLKPAKCPKLRSSRISWKSTADRYNYLSINFCYTFLLYWKWEATQPSITIFKATFISV